MNHDIWKTLLTRDFNREKYLYHYTSLENALSIINNNQICFSPFTKSNDFPEEKLSLSFIDKKSGMNFGNSTHAKQIIAFFKKRYDKMQLLCFCLDYDLSDAQIKKILKSQINPSKDKYFDITGRGFAIPLMWRNINAANSGVCLIINKQKFEQNLYADANILKKGKVTCCKFDNPYQISKDTLEDIFEKLEILRSKKMSFFKLITTEAHYLDYNFFYKKYDWHYENEYRYISLKSSPDEIVTVGELSSYLEGIVIHNSINGADEQRITSLVNNRYEIKKISFDDNYCKLI